MAVVERQRAPLAAALVCAVAFVVLAVLVALSVTQELDVSARDYFRPDDEWGALQIRVDVVVEGLKPERIIVLLVAGALILAVARRSWRPAVYAASIAVAAGALALVAKVVLHRTDPHHELSAIGGSFPSGHVMTLMVCLGGLVLLLHERSRWWEWLVVGSAGALMAWSLLVQAAHWLTDVVGGALLAVVVLGLASLAPLRARAPSYDDAPVEPRDEPSEV